MMSDRVITWNTHKVDGGFEFHVYSFGYQLPQETLKRAVCATRAQATGEAKAWARWFEAHPHRAAAQAARPRLCGRA